MRLEVVTVGKGVTLACMEAVGTCVQSGFQFSLLHAALITQGINEGNIAHHVIRKRGLHRE